MFAEHPAPSVAARAHHMRHGQHANGGTWLHRSLTALSLAEAEQQLMHPSASVSHMCVHGRLTMLSLM
jgi:hypothetical protein